MELLKVSEVAEMLKVKPQTIYNLKQKNEIPFIQIASGTLRFDKAKIEEWIQTKSK